MINISNSTNSDVVKRIFSRIDIIPFCLLFLFLSFIVILSFAWSIYMLSRLVKERQYLKYIKGLKNSMHNHIWSTKVKNSNTKIVKNSFLLAISSLEWISILIMISTTIFDNMDHILKPRDRNIEEIRPFALDAIHALYNSAKSSVQSRIFTTDFFIIFALLPLILIRILTQYLRQQYAFYSNKSFSLKRKFRPPIAMLIFLFLLGLIRQLIIFQWITFCLFFAYEFFYFTKATKCLCNLLYKRYFDAKTHEYQAKSIVRYYRQAYLEFKICSCILVASLFFQLLSLIFLIIFSLFGIFLASPNDEIQLLFMNVDTLAPYSFLQHYQQQLKIFESACSSIELISLSLAYGLLVLPYGLMSLKVCLIAVRTRVAKSRDYPNHELIRQMIINNNYLK